MALFFLAFVLLISALFIESQATPKQTSQAVYAPGTQIVSGKAQFQIDKVSYSAGSEHLKAPNGKQYVIVDVTIKNISKEPIDVLPANDTYIKDAAGNVSYLSPVGLDNPFRAGKLMADDTIKGQLSFLAAKDTPLKFYIDAIWGGSLISIAIN